MVDRRKMAPRVAPALFVALLALGGPASASSYYKVTNLGYGWDTFPSSDDQGLTSLVNLETGARMPFQYSPMDGPVDRDALPTKSGYLGVSPQKPFDFEMRNPSANPHGTVIGSYPDGTSLANPYVSLVAGYVLRGADGSYGAFVPLTSGNYNSILLNDRNQVIYGRNNLLDIASQTTREIADLISPEDIADLGPTALFPDLYWGTAFGLDGTILARLQTQSPRGDVTLLLTPTHAPEPSTLALLVAAGAGVAYRRYRRR